MPNQMLMDLSIAQLPHKLFHPYRILIMMALADDKQRFHTLKRALGISDGNLASHLRALEQEGYVRADSYKEGRQLKTFYSSTDEGITAFAEFRKQMLFTLGRKRIISPKP